MVLVDLGQYRRKEIGAALRYALERYERGELTALALCCKDAAGCEEISFTGEYKCDTARALSAALKMRRRLEELEDTPCDCC